MCNIIRDEMENGNYMKDELGIQLSVPLAIDLEVVHLLERRAL